MSNGTLIPPPRSRFEWFRYFPFEWRSWKRQIADSNLPDDAQELIRHVIQKSRLLRFEKIEVIQELISHFEDGQAAGAETKELIANFGDPNTTAKLVTRSKKRNRPIMFKSMQIFGWMLLGIASLYGMLFAYYHSASPSVNTDYLAEFNSHNEGVAEADKAWPIYRPMWIKYGICSELSVDAGGFDERFLYHAEADDTQSRFAQPGDPEWPDVVTRLEELSDLLDSIRTGGQKPRFGFDLQTDLSKYSKEDFQALYGGKDANVTVEMVNSAFDFTDDPEVNDLMHDSLLNIRIPHLQSMRTLARLLAVDMNFAVDQNDPGRATENFVAFMGLAEQSADNSMLVGSLIGYAVAGIGFNQLEETILNHPTFLQEEHLATIQDRIAKVSFEDMTNITGERSYQLDLVQRSYSDNGDGTGRITPLGVKVFTQYLGAAQQQRELFAETGDEYSDRIMSIVEGAISPGSLFFFPAREEIEQLINTYVDDYAQALAVPYWERELPDDESHIGNSLSKRTLFEMIAPGYDAVISASARIEGRQEGVLAGLAFQRYFLKHGEWPEKLVEISPEFITELPVDIINGNEMLFTFDDDGPVLYGVGNDLDDDGGVQVVNSRGVMEAAGGFRPSRHPTSDSGDWILWPQSRYDQTGRAEVDSPTEDEQQ